MKIKEFFRGTPEEIAATEKLRYLRSKPRLNTREREEMKQARFHERRLFLKRAAAVVVGGVILGAGGVVIKELVEDLSGNEDERRVLGEKIRNWKLPDGTSMRTIVPELDLAGTVFQKKSLETFMPTATQPVNLTYFDQGLGSGRLSLRSKSSEDKTIKIVDESKKIVPSDIPLLTSLNPEIMLSKSIKGKVAELALAAKEATQIADFLTYCKVHRALLQGKGAKFTVIKPDNVSVSEDLVNASIAIFHDRFERREFKSSMFHQLVDLGSFIRMGGIVFANWRINYPNEIAQVPKDFISSGEKVAGFLLHEGVIAQRGNTFRYTQGLAPQIDSKEFQTLLSKASGLQFSY